MLEKVMVALSLAAAWAFTAAPGYGQAAKAGSADARERIQKQQDAFADSKGEPGELTVAGLKVGAKGWPSRIDAKVQQVIDANSMLVGIEDARTNSGRYTTWIMVKCPTAGITDGKFWRGGQWKDLADTNVWEVTGTTTYKTLTGTKTVFVVEPYRKVRNSRSIAGAWREGPDENNIRLEIVQDGEKFTADCTYQHKEAGKVQWRITGTITKEGKITGRLVHTMPKTYKHQLRTATLSADGNTISGRAEFDGGGGHEFSWTRVMQEEKSKK